MTPQSRVWVAACVLALVAGTTVDAHASMAPRDYEGPLEVGPPGQAPPQAPPAPPAGQPPTQPPSGPPPPAESPPAPEGDDGFAVEDESLGGDDDGFEVEDADFSEEDLANTHIIAPTAPADPAAEAEDEAELTGECDADGFCFEDLSEDEEALAREAEVPKVEVKGPHGTVSGKILDASSGSPLIGVDVEVVGTKYKTTTGVDGTYTLDLPPGTYNVRIRYDTYEGITFERVVVGQDKTVTLNQDLKPIAGMTQTVVVEGEINRESSAGKLLERKKSTAARDMMSRDDISKAGGGSTSSVARRIVGSSVVGGRYLFVRGLGHRYGNTLFDGARVPSPDPSLRTVPLDIFPSSALGAINIQKTAMPDVPADFAGASVQLESREAPDDWTFTIGADFGVNTATSFRESAAGDKFAGDGVGFGNIGRQLPPSHDTEYPIDPAAQAPGSLDNVFTAEEIEALGESFPSLNTAVNLRRALPNFGAKASLGNTFHPYGTDLGFLTAVSFSHQTQTLRELLQVWQKNDQCADDAPAGTVCELESEPNTRYRDSLETTQNVRWAALGLLKWKFNRYNRLELLGMYTRDADNEARRLGNYDADNDVDSYVTSIGGRNTPVVTTRLRYQMRSIVFTRLGGKHEFPSANRFAIDWFGSYAQARQDDPLLREVLVTRNDADIGYVLDPNESGKFQFMNLVDNTGTGAINFTAPFKQWRQIEGKVKFGVWAEGKARNFSSRTFRFKLTNGTPAPVIDDDNYLNPDSIGGSKSDMETQFYPIEFTREQDSYTGNQEIFAGYAMLELPFVRWFKMAGGVRYEYNNIRVRPYDRFGRPVDPNYNADIRTNSPLPSLALIFSPNNSMNIRLSGSQTVARPEFRELSPFLFTDFIGGYDVQGQPNLRASKIWNADLRWEWFPSATEVVAISGFTKYFIDPIERVIRPRIPPLVSYQNAQGALNVGVELEGRKNLEFIHKTLRDLSIGVNFAYIYSKVQIDPNAMDGDLQPVSTNLERPMEGQSPYVLNAYIGYDNDNSGTALRLLFNTFGRRIAYVGGLGLPDIYEEPIHSLDFVLSQRLYKGLGLDLGVGNILNWQKRLTIGSAREVTNSVRRGVNFTLGLKYTF